MALSGSVADLPRSETSTLETPSPLKRCLWAADDVADSLDFSLADETDSFEQAFHLVHDQYVWRGYMNPDPVGLAHQYFQRPAVHQDVRRERRQTSGWHRDTTATNWAG
jgi:hypothetical protein